MSERRGAATRGARAEAAGVAAIADTRDGALRPSLTPERNPSLTPRRSEWTGVLGPSARCPPEMALVLGEVCVDRWEASLVRVFTGGRQESWPPYASVKGVRGIRAVSRPGVTPQGYVSGEQADRACAASGKRLCGAAEWDAACRGPRQQQFPYGNHRVPKSCNDDGRARHPVAEVTEKLGLPLDRMWYETMAHPLINQLEGTVTKTGERSACTNGFGVFDMVGNLHEWIDDAEGTFRGGFFMDTRRNGEGCDYATTAHARTYHDYSTGFRCCLDADPVE
ncbi:MAG: hypothetical protein EXR75_07140 [Myxococcales bacterium]|nr:hypothetical protein [Myxococcales bacterium]